jgi:hypothetical protein
MKTKTIGPRISAGVSKFYEKHFRSVNSGAEYTLSAFHNLCRSALVEVKGLFSAGELCLMIDVLNGTLLTPEIAGQTLYHNCIDGIALDFLDQKWEVDEASFKERLKSLTSFQAAALEIWAKGFWEGSDYNAQSDPREYAAVLAREEAPA